MPARYPHSALAKDNEQVIYWNTIDLQRVVRKGDSLLFGIASQAPQPLFAVAATYHTVDDFIIREAIVIIVIISKKQITNSSLYISCHYNKKVRERGKGQNWTNSRKMAERHFLHEKQEGAIVSNLSNKPFISLMLNIL